ncbi:hypothetical protein KC207_14200 [Phycicoccus sp. BSK3Z-2]|uniref:Uncharacterized protein n=1 Tax=Phycicoccus avicenniae TaxID=2828860 RepID=A0A941HZT5_9MICO|nr:hypothetical protein [Phycicoccus avicenniae]
MSALAPRDARCPSWCEAEHTDDDWAEGFYPHSRTRSGVATGYRGVKQWFVDIDAEHDGVGAQIGAVTDDGMTATEARAMAQALLEAADTLEASD